MNLINLFGNKKKEEAAEYFLAVEIHESLIKSVSWKIVNGEPEIVRIGSFEMWTDEESLLNGVDASITEAARDISPAPHRVIFGLPDSWLGETGIHPTKKRLISRIVEELNLKAVGVVPTTQAITHFLKKKEGIPPTAILLEIFSTKVVVSVIRLGKVEHTEEVGSSGDLARDVEEGLARMEIDRLPARFLLTDGGSLEDEQQQILSYPWQEKLPFVHMPKVEVLPIDFSINSIALSGGVEAAQHIGVEVHQVEESAGEVEPAPITTTEESTHVEEISNISIPEQKPSISLSELGFSYEETSPPESIVNQNTENVSSVEEPSSPIINHLAIENQVDTSAEYAVPDEIVSRPPKKKITLPKIQLPKISLPGKKLPLFILIFIPLAISGVSAFYFFLGSAKIIIHLQPQKYTENLDLAIALSPQGDTPTLIAEKKTVTGTASDSLPTTGEATVGDKASGNITIFNRSVAPISLKKGSLVQSDSGGYAFVLADAITIASKSADLLSGSEVFGKKEGVAVSASKIGAEQNLSKNSTFTVDNYSKTVLYAVSESDFSGGTSRTVRAVSKADQDKLLQIVTDKIKAQTQTEIANQDSNSGTIVLSDLTFSSKKFDFGVGEEATSLNLSLSGSVDLLVYSKSNLFNLVSEKLKANLPVGTTLQESSTSIDLNDPVKTSDSVYTVKASVSAGLIPEIDTARLTDLIKGKTRSSVSTLLQTIPGYVSAEALTSPMMPILGNTFIPLNKISFEIIAD